MVTWSGTEGVIQSPRKFAITTAKIESEGNKKKRKKEITWSRAGTRDRDLGILATRLVVVAALVER
jgi:hypothetical protein